MGKSAFDAFTNHRGDSFFAVALGLSGDPAASTLHMQLNSHVDRMLPLGDELLVALLKPADHTSACD
jgi:hypothetical protein